MYFLWWFSLHFCEIKYAKKQVFLAASFILNNQLPYYSKQSTPIRSESNNPLKVTTSSINLMFLPDGPYNAKVNV